MYMCIEPLDTDLLRGIAWCHSTACHQGRQQHTVTDADL